MGEGEEALLQLNNQDILQFMADALALIMMFLWPSLKTIASLRKKYFRGHWQTYWVGLSILASFYYVLRPLLIRWKAFPFVLVISCIVLSHRNGALLRSFATVVVCYFYSHYYEEIYQIPSYIVDMGGNIFSMPLALISKFLGIQNQPPGMGISPTPDPIHANTTEHKRKRKKTRTGAKTQQPN